MMFFKSQLDKFLVAGLFVAMCGFGLLAGANDKLATFALQSAVTLLGCLLTLVTARRPVQPDPTLTAPAAPPLPPADQGKE